MPNKFSLYLKLMRASSPTGYLLVFFPSCYGLILASPKIIDIIKLLPLFFIGSFITRSAGCIINDIFDRDFDKYVDRTKNRPLASGLVSLKEALILLLVLLICSLLVLLSLNHIAIYLGCAAFIMILLYPLTKRFTNLPQIFLGLTFNFGSLIGYAAVANDISLGSIIMYLACCCWTIGYDTIYGFMDYVDDKKIGIKSLSLLLEQRNYRFYFLISYLSFIGLFSLANILINHHINYLLVAFATILLFWQILTLKIDNPQNCLTRFKNNNYVGFILLLAM